MSAKPYENKNTFCGKCKTEMTELSSKSMDGTVWKKFACPDCKVEIHQRTIYDAGGNAYVSYSY